MTPLAVIGAGYVGLATAVALVHQGHRVRVSESDPQRLAGLLAGIIPFEEPGLPRLVAYGLETNRLTFHATTDQAVADADAVIVTGPVDALLGLSDLAWRGIRSVAYWYPTETLDGTVTPAYVVNCCHGRVPYTRTVETKHATGQAAYGTVVCEEHPTRDGRYYPVPTPTLEHERRNLELRREVEARTRTPTYFTGRLADYAYISQDQTILRAIRTAERVIEDVADD